MKHKINLVIPMSGQGTRFQKAGYTQPKPLVPIHGAPMIERVLDCFPKDWATYFVMAENHLSFGLGEQFKKYRPKAQGKVIPPHAKGPGHALLAILDDLPPDEGVLVNYCDCGMSWDPAQFQKFVEMTSCDACLISYRGFHPHYLRGTNYAFSRIVDDLVVEVQEKRNFTNDREQEFASSGGYYFRTPGILKKALQFQIENDLSFNGEYFTSLTVQALIKMDPRARVKVFEVPYFFQWGTPEDVWDFEYWRQTFSAKLKWEPTTTQVEQLLMPMAGKGSRFNPFTKTRKPLIRFDGEAMYEHARSSLPRPQTSVAVVLEEHSAPITGFSAKRELKKTPEGQALSTEEGLSLLDMNREVLVSACDHGIVLNPSTWEMLRKSGADTAIFCIKGFPGVQRSPLSFAYVETIDQPGVLLPEVKSVSVKRPLSEQPLKDWLLVGTFWFKNGIILKEGIDLLKSKGERVNNELYLDSIFKLFLEKRTRRVVVCPIDGYMNWGDPESLSEALYWKDYYTSVNTRIRGRFIAQ